MSIVERIEKRVAVPGDSETRRSQKALAALVLLFASPLTFLVGLSNYGSGLTREGWVFMVFSLLLLVGLVLFLRFPSQFVLLAYGIFVVSLSANLAAHLSAGGTTAGSFNIGWAVLTPLLAALILDRRAVMVTMFLFLLVVGAVVMLEPWARSTMPDADPAFRLRTFAFSLASLGVMVSLAGLYLVGRIENYRQRADGLLLNILPDSIAERLKQGSQTIADGYSQATVLFADIVDFTRLSTEADPVKVVNLLNSIFSEFDQLAEKHGLEKIKTIGDAYMVAAGLPEPHPDHVEAIADFALEMREAVRKHRGLKGEPVQLRIGINTGPVVAGVIGRQKFIYDLWGDAVNVASRMESNGLPNEIQVTAAVKEALHGRHTFIEREPVPIKGKGMMVTYLLKEGLVESGPKAVSSEQ